MTWNYRVLNRDGFFTIIEAYYDDDDRITLWADDMYPIGDVGIGPGDLSELAKDLNLMVRALSLPVLTLADLPKAKV